MSYVQVPKDLNKVKTKVAFNLTKRQIICFSLGIGVSLPVFFMVKKFTDTSSAAMSMVFMTVPFFLFGMFEKNGRPLEKILTDMANVMFLRPKRRLYRTQNIFKTERMRENSRENEIMGGSSAGEERKGDNVCSGHDTL